MVCIIHMHRFIQAGRAQVRPETSSPDKRLSTALTFDQYFDFDFTGTEAKEGLVSKPSMPLVAIVRFKIVRVVRTVI
jgi:hypothetical protein